MKGSAKQKISVKVIDLVSTSPCLVEGKWTKLLYYQIQFCKVSLTLQNAYQYLQGKLATQL